MAKEPSCRLHYFEKYGTAEPIRMALKYFGVEYAEKLYTDQEWLKVRTDDFFEFSELPVLEIADKRFVQPVSILRYICQQHNAYPTDPLQRAKIEAIVELRYEIYDSVLRKIIEGSMDEVKAWYRRMMPSHYLPIFEDLLTANRTQGQGKFFVGASVSMADFVMFELGFTAFLRPEMRDLMTDFKRTAPQFFEFLESFKNSKPALTQYMNQPKVYQF